MGMVQMIHTRTIITPDRVFFKQLYGSYCMANGFIDTVLIFRAAWFNSYYTVVVKLLVY